MVLYCARKQFYNTHRDASDGTVGWKKLTFAFRAVCRIFPCANLAFADCAFGICFLVMPLNRASERIVHAALAEVFSNW